MRDAMGGSVVLTIIVLFIVVALGYLAFNVNYTKAFRMKNRIIAIYEDYNGECYDECNKKIIEYSKTIGYTGGDNDCPEKFNKVDDLYCVLENKVDPGSGSSKSKSSITHIKGGGKELSDIKGMRYFTIVTRINMNIPIISNIIDFKFFNISGDTKTFEINK